MKLNVTHLASGARSEEITENCCEKMLEARTDETIGSNADFIVNQFSDDYQPFNIFRYEDNNKVGFYPIEFCPFCGQQIVIEFIDGRLTSQD